MQSTSGLDTSGSSVTYHADTRHYVVLANPRDPSFEGWTSGPAKTTWPRLEARLPGGQLSGSAVRLRRVSSKAEAEEEGSAAASLLQAAVEAANTLGDVRVEGDLNPAEVRGGAPRAVDKGSCYQVAQWQRCASHHCSLGPFDYLLADLGCGLEQRGGSGRKTGPCACSALAGWTSSASQMALSGGILARCSGLEMDWLAVMVVLFFPKAVALCVVLACRYVVKGVVALIIYFGKELLHQLAMTVHEVEDALVDVLSSYLQPSPQPLGYGSFLPSVLSGPPLQMGDKPDSPSPPPTPTTEVTQPTRPLDVLTVLLLVANLFRGQPGGGGGANPQG